MDALPEWLVSAPHDALAVAAARGDREAFGALYETYVDPIHRYLRGQGLRRAAAEDVVSQTFLKALDRIGQYDPGKGPFAGWLYTIARNGVHDYFRKERRSAAGELEDVPDPARAEDPIERDEQAAQLRALLAELTPEQRELIILRVWEDKPYEEVAALVGKSADACKMAFSRIVARLRDRLPPLVLFLALLGPELGRLT